MTLASLHALLEGERGLLAAALVPDRPLGKGVFGPLVAAGHRTQEAADEYALVVESIFEGYLLHYARARVLDSDDPDLRLLSGDYLYALGLSRLARLGDLEAIAELAELITLCAQAHAGSDRARDAGPWELTGGLWAICSLAIAAGPWDEAARSKLLAREGREKAAAQARRAAIERAAQVGLALGLEQALIAFDRAVNEQPPTA